MTAEVPVLRAASVEAAIAAEGGSLETAILPQFIARQRWFGSKARAVDRVRVIDTGPLGAPPAPYLVIAEAAFADGGSDRYALPMAVVTGEQAAAMRVGRPSAIVGWLDAAGGHLLVDALADDDACRALLRVIDAQQPVTLSRGVVHAVRDAPSGVHGPIGGIPVRRTGAEQSNSSVLFGSASILKLYRRLEAGPHPELELGRYLLQARFTDVPALLGSMEYVVGGERSALAVLHAVVPDATDGWEHALEHVERYFQRVGARPAHEALAGRSQRALLRQEEPTRPAAELVGDYVEAARTLGQQTAALHLTLSRGSGEALAPEPLAAQDIMALVEGARARGRRALALLASRAATFDADVRAHVARLIGYQPAFFARLGSLAAMPPNAVRTRCHQDYHLGQLLWTGRRYALLDFEGEPARPLPERRAKRSPLTDVAGMLRSYSYAAWSGLFAWSRSRGTNPLEAEPWAALWESTVVGAFLSAYLRETRGAPFVPVEPRELTALLTILMLDKAMYELEYELNNRPGWVLVPVEGLIALLGPGH